jgi:hypothetical protein
LLTALFTVGFGTAVWAATAHSSWVRFFGPTKVNGQTQCSDQQTSVKNTNPRYASGGIRSRRGASCNNTLGVPAGYLGVLTYLIKDSSGVVCGFRDWTTNSVNDVTEMTVPAYWTGPSSNCPASGNYHGRAAAKFWRADNNAYVFSNFVNSPSLGF